MNYLECIVYFEIMVNFVVIFQIEVNKINN